LAPPRLIVEAYHVSSVPAANATNTKMYVRRGVTSCGPSWMSAMLHSKMRNQVQERKEENPNDVDEVPIKAHHLDWTVILRAEVTAPRARDDPHEKADADHHVQRMQPGHSPIEDHEQLHFGRELRIFVPREM